MGEDAGIARLGATLCTSAQRVVAEAFLAEAESERRHVVVYLSGAHAYGFPSPDSDLDLKAVHLAPTQRVLGLRGVSEARDPEAVDRLLVAIRLEALGA